jgi:predicted acylesterase/phospholipase RssA
MNALSTLRRRLAHARSRTADRELGETVALATGASLRDQVQRVIAAARAATPRSVMAIDRDFSFAGAVTAAEGLASMHATVLLPAELDARTITTLLRESDRVVALAGTAAEAAELAAISPRAGGDRVEVVLVGEDASEAAASWPAHTPAHIVRRCELPLVDAELAWLGRHLTRTKLGLVLGAGGAKGYAHVGVLQVLEEAGYTIDSVAGSSIGAIVGTLLALGAGAAGIDAMLREAFTPANIAEIFKVALSGRATGLDVMTKLLREMTGDRTFADASIPLTVMAVDLDERAPAPLRDGTIWEALLAATALAGVFPPQERDGHRLVDGLALVPVPTASAIEDGADLTLAVNLIGRESLAHWPGEPPPPPPEQRRRKGMLDSLLEVMDLSQLEESCRHTEMADVPVTPVFGPCEWRDFHLADAFLAAGRAAAEQALATLRSLASPAISTTDKHSEGGSVDNEAVRI